MSTEKPTDAPVAKVTPDVSFSTQPVEPCQCSCHPNGIERSEGCDCGCCDHAHVIIDRGDDEVDRLLREQGYYPGGKHRPVEPLCQCGHTKRSHNDKGCWHGKAECGCDAYKPVEPAPAVVSPFDYDALDTGIRETVRLLREAGFETTDSGDGMSKPADERVFHQPHVVIVAPDLAVHHHMQVAQAVLGPAWYVEANISTRDASVILTCLRHEDYGKGMEAWAAPGAEQPASPPAAVLSSAPNRSQTTTTRQEASPPAAEPRQQSMSAQHAQNLRVVALEAKLTETQAEVRQLVETERRVCTERDAALAEVASLRAELARIDAVMARRPALDQPTRWQNIEKAITAAGRNKDRASRAEREAALAEARRLIQQVEWVYDARAEGYYCLWCEEEKPNHAPGCPAFGQQVGVNRNAT